MKTTTKIILGALAGLVYFLGMAVTLHLALPATAPANLGGSGGAFITEVRTIDGSDSSNATSSLSFVRTADTASTTFQFPTANAESVDLNMMIVGSSTATKLTWRYEFSDNGIDWYGEDGKTVDSAVSTTHSATTTTHYWTPGTVATSTKNVGLTPTASQYVRVKFGVSGANAAIWVEAVKKKLIPN